jgi:hypothetical protein
VNAKSKSTLPDEQRKANADFRARAIYRKRKTRGLSGYPQLFKAGEKIAKEIGMSFSSYTMSLIKADLIERGVLRG